MPNFIICGSSRAGKSTLSRRLATQFKLAWLVGDCLVEALECSFPETGVQFHGNEYENANIFTDYLCELLRSYQEENVRFVLDTVHIRPDNIITIQNKIGHIPSVFLGYTDSDPVEKLQMIRKFDPKSDFWSAKMSDKDLMDHIIRHQNHAKTIREDCLKYNIPYYDTGKNYETALNEAYDCLVSQL